MKHVLPYLCERPWAITERAMATMLDIYESHAAGLNGANLEAVAAKLGKPLENSGGRVEVRGNIAILDVQGPLFRYANLFTDCSGATSVEMLGRDLGAAVDNRAIETIVLNINSPGGEADGIGELAELIRSAQAKKPVVAYVGGIGASGGYWLASAASRIVLHETAFVGSIGCVATFMDARARLEKEGIHRYVIVSSQSPHKHVDIATKEGQLQILGMVDAMAEVFIGRVAQYRKTTAENVIANFGKGFVLPARQAIAAGMADSVGSYEGLIATLQSEQITGTGLLAAGGPLVEEQEVSTMAEDKQPTTAETRAEAVKVERSRIQAILGCEEAKGRETLARHLALETDMDPEIAKKALAAAHVAPASPESAVGADAFAEQMRKVENPKVGIGTDAAVDDDSQEIAAIVQFLPTAQRRAS